MAIEYIDGIRLYRSITAGLRRVVSRQEYLNKINVFPVPDGAEITYKCPLFITVIVIEDFVPAL